jgi:polar amino acid transport system permease protein
VELLRQLQPSVAIENLGLLLQGLKLTVGVSVVTMALGLVVGLLIALARVSRYRLLGALAYLYTELFRTLPLLALLFWIYSSLPILTGITFTPFVSAVLAFALIVSAHQAEIYRAGITSIAPAQRQAALALGMSNAQVMRRIVLPQAAARILPVTGSLWISLFKDSSLASIIAVHELMFQGRVLAANLFRPIEILTTVAVIYVIALYPQAQLVNFLYRRFTPDGG